MKRLYVIVRKKMKCSIPAVQAGHALAQWMLDNPEQAKEWNNSYLIYLQLKNLIKLDRWMFKLDTKNIPYTVFREPDLDNEPTAIAVYLEEEDGKRLFKDLKLLKW